MGYLNNDYAMSVGKVSGCCVKQNSKRQCSVEHDGRIIQQRHCIIRSCHKLLAAKALSVTCSNVGIIKSVYCARYHLEDANWYHTD